MEKAWTPYRLVSAATDNATSVKASAAKLGYVVAANVNAAVRYLHIYDKASAPTLGTDVPKLTVPLTGGATGPVVTVNLGPLGVEFVLGLAFAITTTTGATPASGAVAANEISVSLGYK